MSKGIAPSKKEFELTGAAIDALAEAIETALADFGMERQNILRIRLSLEESLLRWRDFFGEETTVVFTTDNSFGRPFLQLEIEGDVYNPLSKTDEEVGDWSGGLLTGSGFAPQYLYTRGKNQLRILLPPKRMNPALKILLFVAAGILVGVIGSRAASPDALAYLTEELLEPIYDIWNRILLLISGPVIFLMVATTLLNTGAISEQGGNSRKVVVRYFAMSFVAALVAGVAGQLVYHPTFIGDELGAETTTTMWDQIMSLIPENIFAPFIDANTPQLLLLAFVLGEALLVAGSRTGALNTLVKQGNVVGQLLAEWISRMVCYFAAVLIVLEILRGKTGLFLGMWKPFLGSLVISALFMGIILVYVAGRKKVSMKNLWDKLWGPFQTAMRNGSLDASYGQAEQTCIQRLGIEKNYTRVGLPQGLVLYMPINVIGTLIFTIYAANSFGVTVGPVWFVIAMILAVILFVATPPVPGANLLAYIAIFAQLGIAGEVLIDAMIFDILFGIFASAANQWMLQLEMVLQADHIGLLDHKKLEKPMR